MSTPHLLFGCADFHLHAALPQAAGEGAKAAKKHRLRTKSAKKPKKD
jgi:hypothetical protein